MTSTNSTQFEKSPSFLPERVAVEYNDNVNVVVSSSTHVHVLYSTSFLLQPTVL